MAVPDGGPTGGPASILTEEELRVAVLGLLGDSYDRAVESRTGLSKTTVNDLRNHRRGVTLKTLTLIVDTYDPQRRDEWVAAWRRTRSQPAPDAPSPTAGEADPDGPSAPIDDPLVAGAAGGAARTRRVLGRRHLVIGGLIAAACVVVAATTAVAMSGHSADPGATARPAGPATAGDGVALASQRALPGGYGALGPVPPGPPPPGAPAPVGGPGAGVGGPPPPAGEVSTRGCTTMPLRTKARVVPQPGARASGVSLKAAAYTYYPAWNPSLAIGGQLSRPLPAGQRLVGADWSDPATKDSTPAHSPGNGRFYPGGELSLTDQNCFTVPPYSLGYGGYLGLTTRVYVLLLDADRAATLAAAAARVAGFTENDLADQGVEVLGYFVVPPTGT